MRDDLLAQAAKAVEAAKAKKSDVRTRAAEGHMAALNAKLTADRAR